MIIARHVLHIINGEYYAGAERVQDLLAERLPEHGFDVEFACIKPLNFPAQRRSTVPLFSLPMRSRVDVRVGRQIATLAQQRGYSLLHTHSVRSALVGRMAASLGGLPIVHQVHSPSGAETESRGRNLMLTLGEQISLAGAEAVVVVSENLKQYIQHRRFPSDRIYMVPNGVRVRSELPVWVPPADRPWEIGVIALFRPRKGLEVLLDALSELSSDGFAIRLRAVGSFEKPDYEAHIKYRAQAAGLESIICWTGYVKDVDAELARMDVLVVPSLYGEGLPMVVLEAMSTGVPLVASAVSGIPQAVRHGVDGLLVDPGSVGSLSRALRALIQGEICAAGLRRSAYGRQVAEFSDESMARNVAMVYRQVLGEGRFDLAADA
jgi:glycosyltransferase involved in cell wall biosynthesis